MLNPLQANNRKAKAVAQVRLLLHSKATVKLLLELQRPADPEGEAIVCARCHRGQMQIIALCTQRGTRDLRRRRPVFADSS